MRARSNKAFVCRFFFFFFFFCLLKVWRLSRRQLAGDDTKVLCAGSLWMQLVCANCTLYAVAYIFHCSTDHGDVVALS